MFDCVNGGSNLLSFSFFLFPPRENSDQPSPVSAFCNRDGLITFPRSQQKDRTPQLCPLVVQQQQQQQHTKRKQTNRSSTITNTHTQTHTTLVLSLFQAVFMVYKSLGFTFLLYVRSTGPDDGPTNSGSNSREKESCSHSSSLERHLPLTRFFPFLPPPGNAVIAERSQRDPAHLFFFFYSGPTSIPPVRGRGPFPRLLASNWAQNLARQKATKKLFWLGAIQYTPV